jgi:hypothetical protein
MGADDWCDAFVKVFRMVSNPGAADETITHWLPANALPTPEDTND